MTDNLFGTDGIRGRAGEYPLDASSLQRLGAILAELQPGARWLVGRDTRESGPAIERELGRGILTGASLFSAGIIPTPALSYLVRRFGFEYGVMISASHNPYRDNGIKIVNRHGEKISALLERTIAAAFSHSRRSLSRSRAATGKIRPFAQGQEAYLEFLRRQGAELGKRPLRLVIDCANGAAFALAPRLYRDLGLALTAIHARPNGHNINANCGSTAPESLQQAVRRRQADLGLAFDGDADRVIFCDGSGQILDGGHTLLALAQYLEKTDPSFNRTVVGTQMDNLGLEKALAERSIRFLRAAVGDKAVYRLMRRSGARLGGEPCGHTIIRPLQVTGDGLLTSLVFLKSLLALGIGPEDIRRQLPLFPQKLLNLPIRRRRDLNRWPQLQRLRQEFLQRHGHHSRLLIRFSGTEAKIRLMLESADEQALETYLQKFADLIQSEIGVRHETER